jgi:glycosyltransferase involved in cell wall biosynthesis
VKLSIFTTITDPEKRLDSYLEAIQNYDSLADEVIIVDGSKHQIISYPDHLKPIFYEWPEEFSWDFIGAQFNRGLKACTGDWIIRADIDYFFHENDFKRIREYLEKNQDAPAVNFLKYQFTLTDRYNIKARCPIALNKKKFPSIRFTKEGGAHIEIDGKELDKNEFPDSKIPFYNYDWTFKTKEIISKDMHRFAKARKRFYGTDHGWGAGSEEKAWEFAKQMIQGKARKNAEIIPLSAHPKYIQETIKNLKPNQAGYSAFGVQKATYYEND